MALHGAIIVRHEVSGRHGMEFMVEGSLPFQRLWSGATFGHSSLQPPADHLRFVFDSLLRRAGKDHMGVHWIKDLPHCCARGRHYGIMGV